MEQLTWPRGSGGHIFSTISASDFGDPDRQQQHRNDSAHRHHCWNHVFEPSLLEKSSRDLRSSDHHRQHHHNSHLLQVDLEEQASASGYGVDQLTGRAQNSSNFSIRKDKKQNLDEQGSAHGLHHLTGRAESSSNFSIRKEQAFDCGVEQATGKSQNSSSFSSRKERDQEASASYTETDADINKATPSMVSTPCTPLQYELHPRIDRIPYSCPYPNVRSHSNLAHTNPNSRNYSHGPVSKPNKVYFNLNLNHGYDILWASNSSSNFAMLPDDILLRIAGSFSWPYLWSASRVCRSWCQALAPLREAMYFVHWGKRFKHGRGGAARNLDKALHSFLNGAKRGCAAAMVDAGLLLWEMGQKQEGVYWYKKAAELGDPAGQCNLGLAYLQDPRNPGEAVKWFQRAALAGHVRAQYSLALCLQQGKGVDCSVVKAARWYQRAAEGGSARAMYNLALCHRKGEGLVGDSHEARKWMKRAALAGHRKAQFEHGLTLFAENDGGLALVFLELATRAGETAATHLRDALIQQLSPKMRTHAITCADKWQAKLNARS
eukprot:c20455_g1_i1 orf=76-1719(+)